MKHRRRSMLARRRRPRPVVRLVKRQRQLLIAYAIEMMDAMEAGYGRHLDRILTETPT